jgi:hypothetical protein
MSYLGKISAIVSANTSDFQSKLSGAAKDVQRFASSMQSSLASAQTKATTSLRGIYTEAQKLERALQAASSRKLSFSGFSAENLQQAADRMRALYSATKEVNQPLAEARGSLEKLSAEVQAGFLPAMISAQSAAERLADTINQTGTASQAEFDGMAKKVGLVTAAVRRLQEASQMVSSLGRGDTLRFTSPRTFDAFSAARRSQQATDALPASVLASFGVGEQQAAVARQADRVQRLEAVRERKLALGTSTSKVDAMIASETDRLEAQVRVLDRRNEAAQKFALIVKGGFVSSDDLARTGTKANTTPFGPPVPPGFDPRRAALLSANIGASTNIAEARRQQAVAQRQKLANEFAGGLTGRGAGGINFDIERRSLQGYTEQLRILETTLARASAEARGPAVAAFARLRDYIATAFDEGRIDAAATRAEIQRLTQEAVRATSAATGMRAGALGRRVSRAGDVGRMGLGNARTKANTTPFGPPVPPGFDPRRAALLSANIGASTNIAEARRQQAMAQRQRLANEFAGGLTGRGAGGINFDIERRSLQGYTEQLRILETTLARASAEARGPAVAAFARLRDYIATAFDEGRIDAAATRTEIQRLTQEAVRATSAATGMRAGALGRRVSRAGDVGRMGLGNASLALNQAAFAIDDFMSSTGGIEFKIRAISNNITQLGFVLGGTFGLFASLGVIVATNVGLFIAKTTGLLEDTKRQEELAKAATDALTDSFENQKKTVEGLAEAYREFSEEVRNSVLSSGDKERASREDTVAGLREQQAARRREDAAIRLPQIMALRARRSDLESQAAKEENQGRQFQLRRQIGQTVRQEDEIVRRTEAAAAGRVRANDVRVTPAGAFIRDQTDQRLADLLANPAGNQRAIEIMSREAAEITVGARQIQDAARVAAVDLALQLRETFEQLQERASGVADFLPKSTNEAITAASREIADFARGRAVTEDAARARFGEISNQMQAIGPQIAGAEALKKQQEFIARTQPDVLREAEAAMARGRELSMTPGQRAAEEAARGLEDIRRNFGNLAADGNGLIDRGGMGEAMSRFATEQARSAAPAIFSMADEVANAVLQGPSRQALQVSDVSTTQGSVELMRLLRGDDAAKNANIVELEKQNQKLSELVTTMKDVAAKMGIVLDL